MPIFNTNILCWSDQVIENRFIHELFVHVFFVLPKNVRIRRKFAQKSKNERIFAK